MAGYPLQQVISCRGGHCGLHWDLPVEKNSQRNLEIKAKSGKLSNIKNKFGEGRKLGSFMQF